jgi:AcrR family transcriptional regulator
MCVTLAKDHRTRNRRGEGARLREEVIAAATRLIEEKGQDAVSLRAIARSAGITAPSIYAHFEDLDDVLEAVVANTFDALAAYLRRGIEAHTDPVARLRGACHATWPSATNIPSSTPSCSPAKSNFRPRSTRRSTA